MKTDRLFTTLFLPLLKICATTFGGGYVIVPLLKHQFVDENHLIDENEMLDLMAIAQSSPGPIAVNLSIMIGYKMAGIKGCLIALLAILLPPLTIISIISFFYIAFKDNAVIKAILSGMLCGVTAILINVVINMISKLNKSVLSFVILIIAFYFSFIFKLNFIFIICVGAAIGIVSSWFEGRRK